MDVEVKIHYGRSDWNFIADYAAVDVIVNGKLARQYGDERKRGKTSAAGFVDGLVFVHGVSNVKVTCTKVADWKY